MKGKAMTIRELVELGQSLDQVQVKHLASLPIEKCLLVAGSLANRVVHDKPPAKTEMERLLDSWALAQFAKVFVEAHTEAVVEALKETP